MDVRTQLIAEEGTSHSAYLDTLGVPTIGIGHTGPEVHLGLVWTDDQIAAAFDTDLAQKMAEVSARLPWFSTLNGPRQCVLLQMAYQMGTSGLMGFANTLAAVHDGRWEDAASGMLKSKWAQQTPARANRLAKQMELGEWVVA